MGVKPEHLKERTFKKSVGWFRNAHALIKLPKDSELLRRKEQGQEKMFCDGKMAQAEKQVRNHGHENGHKATIHQFEIEDEDEDEDETKLRIWIERNISSQQRRDAKKSPQGQCLESERLTSSIKLMNNESGVIPPLSVMEYARIDDTQKAPQSNQKAIQRLRSSTNKSERSNVSRRIFLTDLPNELLDDILQHVRSSSSFQRFRSYLMVCKRLYIVGLPVLYREIFYSSTTYYSRYSRLPQNHVNISIFNRKDSWDKNLKARPAKDNNPVMPSPLQPLQPLQSFSNFAKYIKSFTLAFDWEEWLDLHFVETATEGIEFFSSISRLLSSLQNLESFSLIATPVFSSGSIPTTPAILIKSSISTVIQSIPVSVMVLNVDITAIDSRQPDEAVPIPPASNEHPCENSICTQLKDMTSRLKFLQVRVGHNCTLLHDLADEKIAQCPRRSRRGINSMHAASSEFVRDLCPSTDNKYDFDSWPDYCKDRASLQWWACDKGCGKY